MRPGDVQPSEAEAAELYREAVAARLLDSFRKSEGRPAKTMAELEAWVEKHDDEIPRNDDGTITPLYPEEAS